MATNPPGSDPQQPVNPTPSFSAPPPVQGAPPPTYAAPPPPAGGMPPPAAVAPPPPGGKKKNTWLMACLIIFVLVCCCCCGGPIIAIRSGNQAFQEFMRETPFKDIIEEIETQIGENGSSSDFSWDDESWDSESSGDSSSDDTTWDDESWDDSATEPATESDAWSDEGTSSFGDTTDDAMKLSTWVGEQSMDGAEWDVESGYSTAGGTAVMTYAYIVTKDGRTTRYEFEVGATGGFKPMNDDAKKLARELGMSGG